MTSTLLSTSEYLIVRGGSTLTGEVEISGSKNASLPILIATLLSEERSTILDAPYLLDIKNTIELLENMGVEIKREGNRIEVNPERITNCRASDENVRRMRASVLAMGPLLVRCGEAIVAMPGGCSIGLRPIDQHLKFFQSAGVDVNVKHGYIYLERKEKKSVNFTFDIITVTGTENALMFLSSVNKESVLNNIALEPEVMDLIEVLRKMGADIEIEGRKAIIRGREDLSGFIHKVIPDRIEAGTFMVGAYLTGGDITLKNVIKDHLTSIIEALREAGAVVEEKSVNEIRVYGSGPIKPLNIETREYPGFPTDMQAQFMVLLSLADGVSVIKENIFENRFQHVMELKRMGADISVKGNTAIIKGVRNLTGAEVFSTDLRASAALVIAGLVAEGETTVRDIYHLDRGYENFDKKLAKLGASVQRLPSL